LTNGAFTPADPAVIAALQGTQAATEALQETTALMQGNVGGLQTIFTPPPPYVQPPGTWPWAPATVPQGFLGGRWQRRAGNVYGAAALRGFPGPNSPIEGGESAESQNNPTGHQQRRPA
jgi:hypothetical protein